MDIINVVEELESRLMSGGVSEIMIADAEKMLDCSFSNEYRLYLSQFGSGSFIGHDLTGISPSPAVDVVSVTTAARTVYPMIPDGWYVIENTNIDDLIFWQAQDGKIYRIMPNHEPLKVFDSLADYICGNSQQTSSLDSEANGI